ncbi:YdcF family protein [Lysobacter firmicutimachus]|uniref:YdcF family protein n=1 Tax=Lysobacter firmicutimachus TaxID=1792846 RepID=A0ABU8CY96_9GAMM
MSGLGELLRWPLEPLHGSLGLAALALLAAALRWRRCALALLLIAPLWTLWWSLPVAADGLAAALARGYPALSETRARRADAIVVLGGDIGRADQYEAADAAAPQLAGNRLALGARLWQRGLAPQILLSGGPTAHTPGSSEARRMADSIRAFGVPASALVLEDRSRNTADNAGFSRTIGAARGWNDIILVTSPEHLPRAVRTFERAGWRVQGIATAATPLSDALPPWRPSPRALRRSGRFLKEAAGLCVARLDTLH